MNRLRHYLPSAVRLVLGFEFFAIGLNGFLHFVQLPPYPEAADSFLKALGQTGYMVPMIMAVEVVAGALLLSNRLVPFALLLLAPIVVNIVAFHFILAPPEALTFVVLLGEAYLGWSYRAAFRGVFTNLKSGIDGGHRALPST